MRALFRDPFDVSTIVAFHLALALVVRHRNGTVLALQRLAASATQHHRRISAPVEQHHHLLFFLQPLADFLRQFARDHLLLAGFLKLLPHVDNLDFGQRTHLHAVRQLDERIFIFLRVVIRFERRRGRAEHYSRPRHFCPHHCHIARVVARRVLLLVRRILLLVDDDERQIADRSEHRRPGPGDHPRLAAPYAMPLLRPLRIRQPRMQNGNLVSEYLMQIGRYRRRQPNLRNQQDRGAPGVQHLPHTSQIHRRLSGASDPMEQQAAKLARRHGIANLRQRCFLRRAEFELKRRLARLEF